MLLLLAFTYIDAFQTVFGTVHTSPGLSLSLPNWLAIARILGPKKAVVYVLTIIVLGTFAGWFAGNFVFSA